MAAGMREKCPKERITLAAGKADDQRKLVQTLRELGLTTHVAQNNRRRSALDRHTTRHTGYAMIQRRKPLIEKVFG